MNKAYNLLAFSLLLMSLVIVGICFANVAVLEIIGVPLILAEGIAIILFYLAIGGVILFLLSLIILAVLLIQKVFKDRQIYKYYGR